jgi:hypothetical protein
VDLFYLTQQPTLNSDAGTASAPNMQLIPTSIHFATNIWFAFIGIHRFGTTVHQSPTDGVQRIRPQPRHPSQPPQCPTPHGHLPRATPGHEPLRRLRRQQHCVVERCCQFPGAYHRGRRPTGRLRRPDLEPAGAGGERVGGDGSVGRAGLWWGLERLQSRTQPSYNSCLSDTLNQRL